MSAIKLNNQLKQLGIKVWSDEGNIKFSAPKGAMTPELVAQIKVNKAELIQLLEQLEQHKQKFAVIESLPEDVAAPLSLAQQRLWIIDKLSTEHSHYNIPLAVSLQGKLQPKLLEQAFAEVVKRHQSLRTRFVEEGRLSQQKDSQHKDNQQKVHQKIVAEAFQMTLQDFRESPEQLADYLQQQAAESFDLSQEPLLRVHLIQTADQTWALLIVMHHIISDGWSIGVLVNEVTELYSALLKHREHDLKPLAVQYRDFAHWQREWMQGHVLNAELDYWQQRLANIPTVHSLPLDRSRPAQQTFVGDVVFDQFTPELTAALRQLSRSEGTSLFILLQTAFAVLIARCSRETDVVIGTPVANRIHPALAPLIGFFVNTLVLRSEIDTNASFRAQLKQQNRHILQDFDHQSIPFESLVEHLNPQRELSHSALFQIMFALQDSSGVSLQLPDVTSESLDIQSQVAMFDLNVQVHDNGQTLQVGWEYNSDLFDPETIQQLATSYQALLQSIVANPEQQIARLSLLSDAQRVRLLSELNQTQTPFPDDVCIHELIEDRVKENPGAIALSFEGEHLTYAELDAHANQLAHYLREQGVRTDARVALFLPRSMHLVIAMLATLKAGGAYVPMDIELPPERLSYIVEDAEPNMILTLEELQSSLTNFSSIGLDNQDFQQHLQSFSTDKPELGEQSIDGRASASRNLAYLIYTSGSTGQPKGVMIEHQALVNRLMWMQKEYQLNSEDVVLQKTPYSFDVSVWEFFWPLMMGCRLALAKPLGHKDPMYLAALINQEQVTTLHFVPSMLSVFLATAKAGACDPVKRVFCSGEALPTDLQNRFLETFSNVELHNLYGPTEAAIDVTYWPCQPEHASSRVPIGKPIDNIQLYVLDDNLELLPAGAVGELHIGGVGLARGYANKPELTEKTFIHCELDPGQSKRLYKTGDLVRWSPKDQLEYLGRTDFQVKLRGFRIELDEIAHHIASNANINDSIVLVKEEAIVAYVVLTEGAEEQAIIPEVRHELAAALPEYMIPSAFVVLEQLPLTANGKVDRKALPAPKFDAFNNRQIGKTFLAPASVQEKTVATLWGKILQIEKIGTEDNFFELGGNSLKLIQLTEMINQEFQQAFSPLQLFQYPTIKQFMPLLNITRSENQKTAATKASSRPKRNLDQRKARLNRQRNKRVS